MKIPFHRPIFPNKTIDEIQSVLASGWVTTGNCTHLFEEELSEYLSAKNVIVLNSCTSALHLGAIGSGLSSKDKFIVPTYTFAATIEVGEYIGADPLLVDIDPETHNLDLNKVEYLLKKFGSKIKLIIPVHFAGNPVNTVELRKISKFYGCFLLEDAAHGLESVYNDKKIGNTEDAAAFSFYANKNITTGGEGGAIATNDDSLAKKIRKLSLHGMSKDGWSRYSNKGSWAYDIELLGYKYNITDIASKIGSIQLSQVNTWHVKRKKIVQIYNDSFQNIEGIKLPPKEHKNSIHAWHLYIIKIINNEWSIGRNELIVELNNKGIGTSVHYIPIHMHSYYRNKYGYKPSDFINSEKLSESVISLPLYPDLKEVEVSYIVNSIFELWDEYSKK